jgi:hypothetical protein
MTDLCAAYSASCGECVDSGGTAVSQRPLTTAHVGACAVAVATSCSLCALVHYDDLAPDMPVRARACADALHAAADGTVRWYLYAGTLCSAHTEAACTQAIGRPVQRLSHTPTEPITVAPTGRSWPNDGRWPGAQRPASSLHHTRH